MPNKVNDLTGRRFGKLFVVKRAESNTSGRISYLCRCDCGKEKVITSVVLVQGKARSCGCIRFKDLTGKKFGRLTVLSQAETHREPSGKAVVMWNVRCDCGKKFVVSGGSLRNGNTQSCGCLNREIVKAVNTTHGKSYYRLYRIWSGMKQRCHNPNCHNYNDYGGRGITVCTEWKDNFQAFYDWAMANGYNPNAKRGECTIDRINNNDGYKPSNCRWGGMDIQEQSCNKRKSQRTAFNNGKEKLEINGVKKFLYEWCKYYGLSISTVRIRLRNGWDKITAITTPTRLKKKAN